MTTNITVAKVIVDQRNFIMVGHKKYGRIVNINGRHLVEVTRPQGKETRLHGRYEYASPEELIALLQQYVQQPEPVT